MNGQKIFKSKKAQELPSTPDYTIYFMIAAAIIAIFALFLVIITSVYQVETTTILGNLESSVMEFRLLNSPECFAYQDKVTKRIYSHTIDLEKFNQERVMKCIGLQSSVCFKAELLGSIAKSVSWNYRKPQEVRVTIWPVTVKSKDIEKSALMAISTSKKCA